MKGPAVPSNNRSGQHCDEEAVRAATAGELRLLDPEVRVSPALVTALLDPEFFEFGASGRRWDAASILSVASSGSVTADTPVEVDDISGTVLAPGIVHLTCLATHNDRRTRRSSLWRLTGSGWRLYFRQGTPTHDT